MLLPTATLPATAMTKGTLAVALPRNSLCAAHRRRLAVDVQAQQLGQRQVDRRHLVEVDPVAQGGQAAQLGLVQRQPRTRRRARARRRGRTPRRARWSCGDRPSHRHRAVPGVPAVRAGHPPGWGGGAEGSGRALRTPAASRVPVWRPVRGCSSASSATTPPRRSLTRGSRSRAPSTCRSAIRPGPTPPGRAPAADRSPRTTCGRRSPCRRGPGCRPPWSGCPSARRRPRPRPVPPGSRWRSCPCSSPSTRWSCCSRSASGSTSWVPTIPGCRTTSASPPPPSPTRAAAPTSGTCRWTPPPTPAPAPPPCGSGSRPAARS